MPRQRSRAGGLVVALTISVALATACGCSPAPLSTTPPPPSAATAAPAATSATVATAGSATASGPTAAPPGTAQVSPLPSLKPAFRIIEDDIASALATARQEGKALFVEAWARWCHTCLSMKSYVLPDPSLTPLAERVVFATVDTDQDDNAAFVAKYPIEVWPTLFVIDAKTSQVLGHWQGSASASELRDFITNATDTRDAALDPQSPLGAMLAAKQAQAQGRHAVAAFTYREALKRAGPGWPRRSEALAGLLYSEYRQRHWARCAQLGVEHVDGIEGAAVPADFCQIMLKCAGLVRADPALQARATSKAVARLKQYTVRPPADASVDDKANALAILGSAYQKLGDVQGARRATLDRLQLLEQAAAEAPTPELAATFDYLRMSTYLALGRAADAIAMLTERERQLPDSYEPVARLAQVYMSIHRWREALAALERAIPKAYGPRQLGYMRSKAEALAALGEQVKLRQTLDELIAGYEALSPDILAHEQQKQALEDARAWRARLK